MGIQILMGGAFIVLGLVVGTVFTFKALKAIRSRRWPSVQGDLKSTELRTVVFEGIVEGGARDGAKAVITDFRYSYVVDGQSYAGKRVTFSDFVNKTSGSLKKLQARYKGKSNISVYYNPVNPSESVLIPGASIYNFTPFITVIGFVAAGIYIATLQLS